jgi:hypothetical protein
MVVLTLQIAPQPAAMLPHIAHQSFGLKTESLYRIALPGQRAGPYRCQQKTGSNRLGNIFGDDGIQN